MTDLLLLTAFICIMAIFQYRQTNSIMHYNNGLNEELPRKRQKYTWFGLAVCVMALLVAFRASNVGNDTEAYRQIFFSVIEDSDYISNARYEIGYLYLNKFVGYFTKDPQVLFVIVAIFQSAVYFWFVKKHSKDAAFSTVLYFCILFSGMMNIVRQMIAVAFLFIAVDRILNKHSLRAIIWIVIAFLFHESAIIFLVLPIISYVRYNKYLAFIVLMGVLAFTFTDLPIVICEKFFPAYTHYFSGQYVNSGQVAIFYQVVRNGIFFAFTLLGIRKLKEHENTCLFANSKAETNKQENLTVWCAFGAFALIIFGFKINLIDRVVTYMFSFYVIILPNVLSGLKNSTQKKLKIAICAIMIAYMVVVKQYRPDWNRIFPYEFFWQG